MGLRHPGFPIASRRTNGNLQQLKRDPGCVFWGEPTEFGRHLREARVVRGCRVERGRSTGPSHSLAALMKTTIVWGRGVGEGQAEGWGSREGLQSHEGIAIKTHSLPDPPVDPYESLLLAFNKE
ncbi:hypothetical protein J437_LFUL010303 [Ladona fulva]|uniref:Uncharacterized protein n=1 Tax=Ladona fulva TaxID=123851 RepID=A0A8K0KB12_LADFU|nr:hypothetical protein J437_LFUL010303 [Ladona fulva]